MNTSPFKPGDKVVAYCRYSEGDEQGLKNQSTEEQADAIREFCERNELQLVRVFSDPFASGRSVAKRDHYLEMLSFLLHKKKPDVQGVVLWDFERYGRNIDQAQMDAARLRMAGYKLFSLQQPIMDNGPFAHVLEAMYFASAQNQSDMISADVKRALQNNYLKYKVIPRSCIPDGWNAIEVDMGVLSNGSPRVGYRAEPDPKFVERIRAAVEARIAGAPIREIKHLLGDPFVDHPEKVEKLMCKPLLYGSMTYGGTTIEDYCTPIIDRDTWERLQSANRAAKAKTRRPGSGAYAKDRALLSGLCWCGVCGERVYINRRRASGKMYETYYCNHKHSNFSREHLDDLVLTAALDILTGERYENQKADFLERLRKPEEEMNAAPILSAEISKLDKKTDVVTEAIANISGSRALLIKLADLEAQPTDLVNRLAALDKVKADDPEPSLTALRDNVLSVLNNEKSSTDELRTALSTFITAVITYPDGKVLIRHTLPGFARFESELSGPPTAPPEGVEPPTS